MTNSVTDERLFRIPCTTSARQTYDPQIKCQPQHIMTFDLPIRLQRVSDPVPLKYALNSKFRLMKKRLMAVR